jgi:hypothetical protein
LAPTRRSFAFVVVTEPLLLVAVVVPCAPTDTSNAFTGSMPLYSAMRMSGKFAATLKVTVTLFVPAAAATMFFA